ncbi:MAG: high-affinity branched-chain amino acid ABC transporter permease LivM [Rhodomicrobium sp.]|nr:high-affinity branched-chain amino acid ABC transporter permease LivM [Rhodomicrobium sp.]
MASALREAGITFLLALALFGVLVGLRTDTVNGELVITTHFVKAVTFAGVVAAFRFLSDALIWRPLDGGRTLALLSRLSVKAWRPALIAGLAAGLVLYAIGGLRTDIVEWAGDQAWLAGILADLVTFACMAAFILAFAMAAVRGTRLVLSKAPVSSLPEKATANFGREFPAALLIVAVLLPVLIAGPPQRYAVDTATQILIYVMLGWGLNVVVGLAGLLDLGYVAFYAVGAYTYALIATEFGWAFWVCLPLAGLFAALWGITLGFPVLRLRGDYLAIVTLAFGEIIRIVLINWQSLTGGPSGINRIPRLSFFGLPFERSADSSFHSFFGLEYNAVYRIIFLYYVILVLALLTNFVTLRLRRAPIGRAWEALREDEIACRSLGINTVTTKLSAFAIGAMFGGFAGAFFSARQGFISPESFTFHESALVLAIVVLGGLGSQLGVVIAAVVLVGSAERFRELQDYRMLIFGLSMVLVMIWRPRGLMAGRTPSAVLHEARSISGSFVKEGRG